ncbi:MAG: ATP-binding protein [Microbacteriaceae bacterium]|nr:ATP-binding protein [Microbacteriaceae bacterium]
MSLGLPSHIAVRIVSSSFVRGLHAIALTCLVAAFAAAAIYQIAREDDIIWPAMIAIIPMAVLLWSHRRTRSLFFAISYLWVGAVCTYWYLVTFYSQSPPILAGDAFSIALPKIALVMVGGSGIGLSVRLAWTVIGYVSAEIAGGAALVVTGHRLAFDPETFLAFAATVAIIALASVSRRAARRAQPLLHRAVRDEQLATMRHTIETRAAALMHDTVLSHLAALSGSQGSTVQPLLRAQMERDLEILVGEEWLDEPGAEETADARAEWQQSALFEAIQSARLQGLEVEATGDLTAVSRLRREASAALGLAVTQCLVNVLKHSGTMRAEVVAYGSDDEVTVMVIDAGRGFTEAETGADRLGLRQSVRKRMESVGGSVQVWSTPGRGTSIVIRLPAEPEAAS